LSDSNLKVGGFIGNASPTGGFNAVDIAICTIEKANSLINRYLRFIKCDNKKWN
jgi:DNA polymerase theta